MPIRVTCPNCGKAVKAPDDFAGRSAKCPGCQATITIPAQGAMATSAQPATAPPLPSRVAPPPPPTQSVTPPPPPREAKPAATASRGRWGFLIGAIAATAICGAIAVGVVLFILNRADNALDRALAEANLPQQPAAQPVTEPPPTTPLPSEPGTLVPGAAAPPESPEEAAAREALAQLRETLGSEVPELEGLLGSQAGAGQGPPTLPSTDPADLKLIEVVTLKLLPADINEFRLTNTLEVELRNTSEKTLAGFTMKCELKSPDRDIPWAAATLTHRIPGGLLPGESRKLSLTMTGGLAGVEIPPDAETLGTVTRVEWHLVEEAAP